MEKRIYQTAFYLNMKRKLSTGEEITELKSKKAKKTFDFSNFNIRHVAFKVAYLGQKYSGFAIQPHMKNTIEEELFKAFIECKLISDRVSCNYSRCGRTDKGVSAVGQVIALYVRSNLSEGIGVIPRTGSTNEVDEELPYVRMLQTKLPEEIRVISWAPVPLDFSARFSCLYRSYKYYFPKGSLDIDRMQEAALKLEGEHDFRNFCKLDSASVRDFNRHIHKIRIRTLDSELPDAFKLCELSITAKSFLWHQVRYMMGALTLIGQGCESPDVIDYLLDVKTCKAKPNYSPATAEGLILYDSGFEDIQWVNTSISTSCVIMRLQSLWAKKAIEGCMLRGILESIDPMSISNEQIKQFNFTLDPVTKFPISTLSCDINPDLASNRSKYTLLKDRKIPEGTSFEERVSRIKRRGELKALFSEATCSTD